mgnify:CR=1 FL=1
MTESVVAHPARKRNSLMESAQVRGHVEWSTTKEKTVGQSVPENLTDTYDFIAHRRNRRSIYRAAQMDRSDHASSRVSWAVPPSVKSSTPSLAESGKMR